MSLRFRAGYSFQAYKYFKPSFLQIVNIILTIAQFLEATENKSSPSKWGSIWVQIESIKRLLISPLQTNP